MGNHTIFIGTGNEVQDATNYAVAQGATQLTTSGTTEQGGDPWIVVMTPGEYHDSHVTMAAGVNLGSLGERTVLWVVEDASYPIITWDCNATISGITIEQLSASQPAILVTDNAVQASMHRCIIANSSADTSPCLVQNGGFFRAFSTQIRSGRMVLAPTVNRPMSNPVGMNLIDCRAWNGDIAIEPNPTTYNALLKLENFHLDGYSITSTATGAVIGKFEGCKHIGTMTNSSTYRWEIRACQIDSLVISNALGGAEIWGGFINNITNSGRIVFHTDERP